jgi:hypothetical protein
MILEVVLRSCLVCGLLMLAKSPAGAAAQAGTWRITSGAWAPWVKAPSGALSNVSLQGSTLEFAAGRIIGPAPLGCAQAVYEFVVTPAEGLFQGGLPEPANSSARAVGVTYLPVMTLSVGCDTGVFDYHFVSADQLLTALDNVVWTMTAEVQRKRRFLSTELAAQIDSYFKQPLPADEPPPINGDPFTNSQEYPERFTIAGGETAADTARVRVIFRVGQRNRPMDVMLRRVADHWLVDDLRYEDGMTFRELLSTG